MTLHEALAEKVRAWREDGYPASDYAAIGEILRWAREPEGTGFRLRAPQLAALETYWYLRLSEKTPHVLDLYRTCFPRRTDRLTALGVSSQAFARVEYDEDGLLEAVRNDDDFVREHRLDTLRESLALDYPSYVFALAMGAGKTTLIGAIIATEFAMAMEYPEGDFVQNALVFAPGKTILESLRELTSLPYEKILPPRHAALFLSSVKLVFTRDGEKDIPVVRRSSFNVVVTNTEKIRIQKESIRRSDLGSLFSPGRLDEARAEVANLRLQAIASLPHLAIFSDEAHHTYGQTLGASLKKVRMTVDYLHHNTNVLCVVNTTGTPYFQRQPLKDVVIWYGLSQGIADGILKDVRNSVQSFTYRDDIAPLLQDILADFFGTYRDVRLPNGAPAKLAIYFPQNEDLTAARPLIQTILSQLGESPELCLRNTSESGQAEVDAFNRLNDPGAPHRVLLLVNKGTEGWNCPSLFACALVRRLTTAGNNFVLQAATRCLRQIPGNSHSARIYLSSENRDILDRQLQESYNETLAGLAGAQARSRSFTIRVRKLNVPPLVVSRTRRRIAREEAEGAGLTFTRPADDGGAVVVKSFYTLAEQKSAARLLRQIGESVELHGHTPTLDLYGAATELAGNYHLDVWTVYEALRRTYAPERELPSAHMDALSEQIEAQRGRYREEEDAEEVRLEIVKPDGFEKGADADGAECYTAEISVPLNREALYVTWGEWREKAGRFGFHYDGYNFDSAPERSFFEQALDQLQLSPDDVEDIYFTGAITDPKKTDFFVTYWDAGRPRNYSPDFIIRRRPPPGGEPGSGPCYIVEIKAARFEAATLGDMARAERGEAPLTDEGRKAVALERWVARNPEQLRHEILYSAGDSIGFDQMKGTRAFLRGEEA